MVDAGGAVWSTRQPAALLMNTIASQVTLFSDDSVECDGPIRPGPSLHEWARFLPMFDPFTEYPDHICREAAALGPNDFATRACYGYYLNWVLRQLANRPGDNVTIVLHKKVAAALDDAPDGSQMLVFTDGTRLSGLDVVVLAQGHIGMRPSAEEQSLAAFAAAHGLVYVPRGNPSDTELSGIRPGEAVALRGMGLAFFDYLILLTQGRGGRFVTESGRLTYLRSGQEPVLYAGSRRGVPYHGRGENQKGTFERHEPRFLTPSVIDGFRARMPVVFQRDVWPLISLEVRSVYYATLLAERDRRCPPELFLEEYLPAVVLGDEAESAVLGRFGVTAGERWDWDWIARPHGDRVFTDHAEFRAWLLDYLRADLREARRGNVHSPLKAALDVLRDLRNEVRLVVDHGGLTGSSYRDELHGWYTPLNAFVSIGPPAQRTAEMIALIEAGVLFAMGPGMRVEPAPDGSGFQVSSAEVGDPPVLADALIEARLPDVDIRYTTDPLVRHLIVHGQCRPYQVPDTADRAYQTGGLTVTQRPYHLVDAHGRAHPRRFAFGVPTEVVHWATAAGVRPGVNSVIVGDADAIARASLLAAEELRAPAPHRYDAV
jgi:uncharacterized NAD(P)/FAD-binding protein YdhS